MWSPRTPRSYHSKPHTGFPPSSVAFLIPQTRGDCLLSVSNFSVRSAFFFSALAGKNKQSKTQCQETKHGGAEQYKNKEPEKEGQQHEFTKTNAWEQTKPYLAPKQKYVKLKLNQIENQAKPNLTKPSRNETKRNKTKKN